MSHEVKVVREFLFLCQNEEEELLVVVSGEHLPTCLWPCGNQTDDEKKDFVVFDATGAKSFSN